MIKKKITFLNMLISKIFILSLVTGCGFIDITGHSGSPIITIQPVTQIITEGNDIAFSVVATGNKPLFYQWKKGNVNIENNSPILSIENVKSEDQDDYSVTISNSIGVVVSKSVKLVTLPIELSDRAFTLGVFYQDASKMLNGKTIAQHYQDIGINTFVALWKWPTEDWAYPGYTLATARALKNAGLKAYAGNNQAAVDWINNNTEFQQTIVGYFLGDEPDMDRDSSDAVVAASNTPSAWKSTGDALLSLDNSRPVYANFGKPFALDVWYGNENGSTGSKESDFALYVSPTTVISSDFYGITDPWEAPSNHGIWTYGRAVRNTVKYSEGRSVWGFVETSSPWEHASSKNWMFQKMPASYIMSIVWNMVINGAQGIVYFCHDFSPGSNNKGSYAALLENGVPEVMRATNESVMSLGAVLKTPNISGTTVTTNGKVNVIVLTKHFRGGTYIFAMGDGNANNRKGAPVDAIISVNGESGIKTIDVINDARTITMTEGVIIDHFEPYELHIYRINN